MFRVRGFGIKVYFGLMIYIGFQDMGCGFLALESRVYGLPRAATFLVHSLDAHEGRPQGPLINTSESLKTQDLCDNPS